MTDPKTVQTDEATRTFIELFRRLASHFRIMGFLEGGLLVTGHRMVYDFGAQAWGWTPVDLTTEALQGGLLLFIYLFFMTRKRALID